MTNMYGVRVLGLICMWDAYSTWICTVSWSYMHPHTPSYYSEYSEYTYKSKNCGLSGGSSVYVPCIGALVCASTHGLHMVIIFCIGPRHQRGFDPYLGHSCTRTCHVDYAHRFQDRVLMGCCCMDALCISVLVMISMYRVHILSRICMCTKIQHGYVLYLDHTCNLTHPLVTQTKAKIMGYQVV